MTHRRQEKEKVYIFNNLVKILENLTGNPNSLNLVKNNGKYLVGVSYGGDITIWESEHIE